MLRRSEVLDFGSLESWNCMPKVAWTTVDQYFLHWLESLKDYATAEGIINVKTLIYFCHAYDKKYA